MLVLTSEDLVSISTALTVRHLRRDSRASLLVYDNEPPYRGVEIRTTAGKGLMLSVVRLEPGSVVTDHAHPHEQMGILLKGQLEFTVGGVTRLLGPGDMWRIPGGVE